MDIRISRLSKSYGNHPVLTDFSAVFPEGRTTCIMGPSGCGKTTLLRILLGLETADGGIVEGMPQKKSAVFQEDRLCGNLTALTNIRLVCPKKPPAEIAEGLSDLGLGESMDQPVQEYSGGMCRRVSLLRALYADFEILFLDEPLKGLDEEMRERTAGFLRERTKGKTVVCVTHDQKDICLLDAVQVIDLDK